jgi:hypothetical protein
LCGEAMLTEQHGMKACPLDNVLQQIQSGHHCNTSAATENQNYQLIFWSWLAATCLVALKVVDHSVNEPFLLASGMRYSVLTIQNFVQQVHDRSMLGPVFHTKACYEHFNHLLA